MYKAQNFAFRISLVRIELLLPFRTFCFRFRRAGPQSVLSLSYCYFLLELIRFEIHTFLVYLIAQVVGVVKLQLNLHGMTHCLQILTYI